MIPYEVRRWPVSCIRRYSDDSFKQLNSTLEALGRRLLLYPLKESTEDGDNIISDFNDLINSTEALKLKEVPEPLIIAAELGHIEMLKYLLGVSNDISMLENKIFLAYIFHSSRFGPGLVQWISATNSSIDQFVSQCLAPDYHIEKILNFRVELNEEAEQFYEITRKKWQQWYNHKLIAEGYGVHRQSYFGTPLHYAYTGEIAQILLDNGSKLEAKCRKGCTALHSASGRSVTGISDIPRLDRLIEVLLENGADVHSQCSNGRTALHHVIDLEASTNSGTLGYREARTADRESFMSRLSILLRYGANVHAKDHSGRTPLHLAGSVEVARVLLENGASINERDSKGCTTLHSALGRFVSETLLLRDSRSYTALHCSKSTEMARFFLENGAEVNARNMFGESVLHRALQDRMSGHRLVQIMIKHGADVNLPSTHGRTPLELEIGNHTINWDTVRCLIENGACVNRLFDQGKNLLHVAAAGRLRSKEIFVYLAQQDIDINLQDYDHNTPLHYATNENLYSNQESLLELGADIDLINLRGLKAARLEKSLLTYEEGDKIGPVTCHLFKQHFAGFYVRRDNLEELNRMTSSQPCLAASLRKLKLDLRIELCEMRKNTVRDDMSPLDILLADNHQFISNGPLMAIDLKEYPLYGGLIRGKLIREIRKADLLETSRRYFSMLMDANTLPSLPYEVERRILSQVGNRGLYSIIFCGMEVLREKVRLEESMRFHSSADESD